MDQSILEILRSPYGHRLRAKESELIAADGEVFKYERGVAYLYDANDVSPFLMKDYSTFCESQKEPPSKNRAPLSDRELVYNRARNINTYFMFSMLKYDLSTPKFSAEIGVGSCNLIKRFAASGFNAIAVDFFPWEMQHALEETVEAGDPPFACISAPMARLPFADNSLDFVYFHAALHHALPRKQSDFAWFSPNNLLDTLREVKRVLKPREQGGLFFLLGEGIYPEEYKFDQRHYEIGRQNNPADVFEAWYKISEYETAYEAVGLYPNLFVWQEDFILNALGYAVDGTKIVITTNTDNLSDDNYINFANKLMRCEKYIFPSWVSVDKDRSSDIDFTSIRIFRAVPTQGIMKIDQEGSVVTTMPPNKTGYLLYGPYCDLMAGSYEAKFIVKCFDNEDLSIELETDVLSNGETISAPETHFLTIRRGEFKEILHRFKLVNHASGIEMRLNVAKGHKDSITVGTDIAVASIGR